jgi:hypothetical protein
MALDRRDAEHVFEQLRSGRVPERGLDAFAVGLERQRAEIGRLLDMAGEREGVFKCLRGGYGCGKTFTARLAMLDAQQRGFATSFVVVSDNDLRFHNFHEVYQKVVSELGTSACARGALGDVMDRWIGGIESELIELGADPDGPDFDAKVRAKLDEKLAAMTGGRAPEDMVRVVRAIFDLKQRGELADAGALVSWLSGSTNVGSSAKKKAEIKGDIQSKDALAYLRGILEIVKAAGYAGLVIVVDELETVLRARTDTRGKSLNGLRHIIDAAKDFPGLLWIFTGTPDFFDSRRGVAGLTPLHDRLKFEKQGRFVNVRQPQLELVPFDETRLRDVALKLREIYPSRERARIEKLVTHELVERLVKDVTKGFGGDVGVVPRQFLRSYVSILDTIDQNEDYDPGADYQFQMDGKSLSPEEVRAQAGKRPIEYEPEPDDDAGYGETKLEW